MPTSHSAFHFTSRDRQSAAPGCPRAGTGRNAMCESCCATLACELLNRQRFHTHAEARMEIFAYIEGWYNSRRHHSGLDYLSPIEYERKHNLEVSNSNVNLSTKTGQL
jgi:transposase InsO family protein